MSDPQIKHIAATNNKERFISHGETRLGLNDTIRLLMSYCSSASRKLRVASAPRKGLANGMVYDF